MDKQAHKKKITAHDYGLNPTVANNSFLQWRGSVSSLLSVSLFKLCRGTGRNWSGLTFRFAPLLSPPMPATAESQTLATIGLARGHKRVSRQVRSTKNPNAIGLHNADSFDTVEKVSVH